MSWLSQTLYWITTGLLIPTVCLLLVCVVRALLLSGSTIAATLDRRRYASQLDSAFAERSFEGAGLSQLRIPPESPLGRTVQDLVELGDAPGQVQRILAQLEIAHSRSIGEARLLARVGPMLGLMGTLIPLGPALLGLAEGDLQSLAENMLVACATTVIGLLVGGLGFAVQQTRQRWAAEDLAHAEFAASLVEQEEIHAGQTDG